MLKTPSFWDTKNTLATCLRPLSWVYRVGLCWKKSFSSKPHKIPYPVVSIGNVVMGGSGKTPLTLALIAYFKEKGYQPIVLTQGYGGKRPGPFRVTPQDCFPDVGDEAIILSRHAPTYVASDRYQAASLVLNHFATKNLVFLLDDGHQQTSLCKTKSLLVFDPYQGIGNGYLFPAGPLREPLEDALKRTDMVVSVGDLCQEVSEKWRGPVLLVERKVFTSLTTGTRVIGFAGLGYPQKFLITLKELNLKIVDFQAFPDHHPYTSYDIKKLKDQALEHKTLLVTTEKDFVRIPPPLQEGIFVVSLEFYFKEIEKVEEIFSLTLERG